MLLGYLEFVALLFLPGVAFIEVFNLGGEYSFAERLGLAFGLSMAVDVLVLAFRTSGVLVGSQFMLGIYPGTLELILGASLVAFAVPAALRRKVSFYVPPTRDDLLVLGLVAAQALLVFAHFSKYPVFPQFQSVDFSQHVRITADLQAARATMFPGGLLYYGVHLLMGSLVALSGDIVLEATQYAMGILTVVSPLLVFVAVNSLTPSRRVGVVATLLYVLTGFVWFGSVFDAGLYANFYGILCILLLFALVPEVVKQPRRPGIWLAFLLALGSGFLSHYSFVTVIPALVALPLAFLVLEKKVSLVSLAILALVVIPGVVVAVLRPDLVSLLVQFVQAQGSGNVTGDTSLSPFLAGWPVLRYIVVEVTNDVAAVVTLALAAFGVYVAIRSKNPAAWMLVVWLLAILAFAPFSEAAWRFSYMALVPLLIVAALGADSLFPQAADDRAMRRRSLVPVAVWGKGFIWQLVTYMFLHGSFWHILMNMFILWMFGAELERTWGTREFTKFYFIVGIGAGLINVAFAALRPSTAYIPIIGASGAIYGLLVAYAMLFPERYVYVYFMIPVKVKYLVIFLVAVEFFSTYQPDGVAHFAHLGGALVGFLYLRYDFRWRLKRWSPIEYYNKLKAEALARKREEGLRLMDEVDAILDKINQVGYDNLTRREKKILEKASDKLSRHEQK